MRGRSTRNQPFCWQEKKILRCLRELYKGSELVKMRSLYLTITEMDSDFNGKVINYYTKSIAKYSGLSKDWIPGGLKCLERIGIIEIIEERNKGQFTGRVINFTPENIKENPGESTHKKGENARKTGTGKTGTGKTGTGKTGALEDILYKEDNKYKEDNLHETCKKIYNDKLLEIYQNQQDINELIFNSKKERAQHANLLSRFKSSKDFSEFIESAYSDWYKGQGFLPSLLVSCYEKIIAKILISKKSNSEMQYEDDYYKKNKQGMKDLFEGN